MIDASALHDALRAEGLVPEGEDVHFLACSTEWRLAFMRACDDVGLGELADAKAMLDESQGEVASLEDLLDEERRDRKDAEREALRLKNERDHALTRVAELERMVEVAQEELQEAMKGTA